LGKPRRSHGDDGRLHAGKNFAGTVAEAIAAGLDASTPAVAVARATRPDEVVIADRIADLPARLAAEAPAGPIIVMIGRVFADRVASATPVESLQNFTGQRAIGS
jgi:siroheme synthase